MSRGPGNEATRPLARDPILWAGGLVYLAIVLAYVFPGLNPQVRYQAIELYSLIPVLLVAMAAPWLGLPKIRSNPERLFWGLWTAALGLFLLVRLLYIPFDEIRDSVRLSMDVGYVLFYLSLVLATQVKPDRKRTAGKWRTHDLLEASGTGVFVLVLLVYFVIIPHGFSPAEYDTWIPSLILYFSLDVFILLNLLHLRQTTADGDWRIVYTWLALAALTWAVTDMVEVLFYLGVIVLPAAGPLDFFWYIPWVFILMGARIRAKPIPAVFGKFGGSRPLPQADELLARPGWLVIAALALPVVHFVANLLDLLAPETRNIREVVVLGSLLILLGLAFLYQKAIQRRALVLAEKNREVEASLRLLAAAVEQAPDSILIADADQVVRYANPAFLASEGGLREVVGTPLTQAFPSDLEGAGEDTIEEALAAQRTWEGRNRVEASEDQEREDLISLSPVSDSEGELAHWVVVQKDVTYLAQLERKFRQTQKMEALGTLAGGIAHDFNNILGAIYGYGEMLQDTVDPGSQADKDLKGLLSAAERATELVRQILTFSRQSEEGWVPLSLEPVVREALSLLRATLPSTIEIREDIHEPDPFVMGARHQIHQVILNLGSNAAHAMGEKGGVLEVGLKQVSLDPEEGETLGVPAGDYASLTVRDTGEGMDEITLERIFDPFFTTKAVGKGTGLGLSVVHGAVTGHGGAIRVESEPKKGAVFEVLLPSVPPEGDFMEDRDSPPPPGDGQQVVVVDDEPMLVDLSTQILEGLGYRVAAFTDSEEALNYLLESSDGIEVVVTDQTMPGISGLELAGILRQKIPGLPVLLTTGYSEVLSRDRLEEAGVETVLMKPFGRHGLGWAVANLLKESP